MLDKGKQGLVSLLVIIEGVKRGARTDAHIMNQSLHVIRLVLQDHSTQVSRFPGLVIILGSLIELAISKKFDSELEQAKHLELLLEEFVTGVSL